MGISTSKRKRAGYLQSVVVRTRHPYGRQANQEFKLCIEYRVCSESTPPLLTFARSSGESSFPRHIGQSTNGGGGWLRLSVCRSDVSWWNSLLRAGPLWIHPPICTAAACPLVASRSLYGRRQATSERGDDCSTCTGRDTSRMLLADSATAAHHPSVDYYQHTID